MANDEHASHEASERFRHLPERIKPEDMVAEQPSSVPLPADGGRNAEVEYLIRHLIA